MKYAIIILGIILSIPSVAQDDIKNVSLESLTSNELKILNTYPDSFPYVSVVFKAEKSGNPVWDLAIEDLSVYEDNVACKLLSLEPISARKGINISLVLDHSGSMERDFAQLYADGDYKQPLYSIGPDGSIIYPDNYVSPLDNAKASIRSFITRFNMEKDYISLIGFSTDIDVRIPLTNDTALINAVIDTIYPTMTTALYDAAYEGLLQIKGKEGISIEVLLTDGNDNASSKVWKDVVDKANAEEIPVFIIGLGDANVDTLALIARETHGEFFFASNANSLDSIYTRISKKILSFYDLRYESENFSAIEENRQVRLEFQIADEFYLSDTAMVRLPEEVYLYLQKKERQKKYLIYGGSVLVLLIISGVLIARYTREEEEVEKVIIEKIYPNPTSSGVINIIHNAAIGFLVVRDLSGKELTRQKVTAKHETIELPGFSGSCIVMIEAGSKVSNPVKVIFQK